MEELMMAAEKAVQQKEETEQEEKTEFYDVCNNYNKGEKKHKKRSPKIVTASDQIFLTFYDETVCPNLKANNKCN